MVRWRRRRRPVESTDDRLAFAQEAGLGRLSFMSVLSGTLVAYGAFTVLAALAAGIIAALGFDTERLSANDWRQLGIGGGVIVALVLFMAYLIGGYTAGRMARRSGVTNGVVVFLLGLGIAVVVGLVVSTQADSATVVSNLRSMGVPTSFSEYEAIGTFAGAGALLAMLLGAMAGGSMGERWHGKLARRAATGLAIHEAAQEDAAPAEDETVDVRADERHATDEPEPEHAEPRS